MEKVTPSIVFALLRGVVFLVPAFILMPELCGSEGIWLSLFVSEALTAVCVADYFLYNRRRG